MLIGVRGILLIGVMGIFAGINSAYGKFLEGVQPRDFYAATGRA